MTPEQTKALRSIIRLSKLALGRDDVELLHEHFREIIRVAGKALEPGAR